MPLIEFPDVPAAAGVPDVPREAVAADDQTDDEANTDVLATDDVGGLELQEDASSQWQILGADGALIIEPDSVVSFEYRNEQKLVSHPIERGSFADFNKVATPYDVRMRMTCGGQGAMSRDQFLSQMASLVGSIELCSIVTPDAAYAGANMVHWDYRRENRNGATLLTVDAWFEEVRETAEVGYSNTATASGADAKNGGIVNTTSLSVDTQAAMGKAGVQ